jgi:hypothetical protein
VQAAVIDTSGSFDVLRLHRSFMLRLQTQKRRGIFDGDLESVAEAALERVKIMRVFDFVGVSEAVNELGAEMKAPQFTATSSPGPQLEETVRREVPDSEDEDDEMLFDSEVRNAVPAKVENNTKQSSEDSEAKLGLILVDNIAHAVSPLLKTNYAQGQLILRSERK